MKRFKLLPLLGVVALTGCSTNKVVYISVGLEDDDLGRYSDDIYNKLISRNKNNFLSFEIESYYSETFVANGYVNETDISEVTYTVDIDFKQEFIHANKRYKKGYLYIYNGVTVYETDYYYYVDKTTNSMIRYSVDELGNEEISYLGLYTPDPICYSPLLALIEDMEETDIKLSFFTCSLRSMFHYTNPGTALVKPGWDASLVSADIKMGYKCDGYLTGSYYLDSAYEHGTAYGLDSFTFDFSVENYIATFVEKSGMGRNVNSGSGSLNYYFDYDYLYTSKVLKTANRFEMPEIPDELFTRI